MNIYFVVWLLKTLCTWVKQGLTGKDLLAGGEEMAITEEISISACL